CLQVAANPYVTVLGKPETASSRLNLTQAFNSLGTFLAPFFGGLLILSAAPKTLNEVRAMAPDALQAYRLQEAATVKTPYVGLGIALALLAIAIGSFKLPKIEHAQRKVGEKVNDSIWRHPNLVFGAIAAVSVALSLLSFPIESRMPAGYQPGVPNLTWLAWLLVSGRPLLALVAVASAVIGVVAALRGGRVTAHTGRLLGICAISTSALVAVSMLSTGHVAMWSIILVGFFNSIMFPSIFTLGVAELGPLTGDGSGILIMAIVGGAIIPVAQGALADRIGIHRAFFLPVICYLYILFFALSGAK